ncbi:MAG: ribulose-phosphate 3-epimerase [Ruminiclostridium sp.]
MQQMIWNEKCIIAPSLICLDLCNLEKQIRLLEKQGVQLLHVDILDGHFSPSMPLGLDTVRQLRKHTEMAFDVHLMATEQDFFIKELLDIGVQQLTFHIEAESHVDHQLNRIKRHGVRTGVALKPGTPINTLEYIMEQCDTVLLMLINPGYAGTAGEKQVPYAMQKVLDLRNMIKRKGLNTLIELDGRISLKDIETFSPEKADIFVAGSTCISRLDIEGSFERLHQLKQRIIKERV